MTHHQRLIVEQILKKACATNDPKHVVRFLGQYDRICTVCFKVMNMLDDRAKGWVVDTLTGSVWGFCPDHTPVDFEVGQT